MEWEIKGKYFIKYIIFIYFLYYIIYSKKSPNGVNYGNPVSYDVNISNPERTTVDSWNNTYDCIRMIDGTSGEVNGTIYCQFKCYQPKTKLQVPCNMTTAQGYGEYYQLDNDYYELDNTMLSLNNNQKQEYETMMSSFLACSGQSQCNSLRNG